jgi:hypothetical protein
LRFGKSASSWVILHGQGVGGRRANAAWIRSAGRPPSWNASGRGVAQVPFPGMAGSGSPAYHRMRRFLGEA